MSESIFRHSTRTTVILAIFMIVGTALLAYTFDITRDNIAKSENEAKLRLISQTLPPQLYDNNIISDKTQLPPVPELGTTTPSLVYRARRQGQPVAAVLEAIAPDGYSGKIKLLIAVKTNGEIAGVRVIAHKETPGLGDYIEIGRSKWILVFNGTSLARYADKDWKVKKDGGKFDYITGATITPRAIVKAVHKALKYFQIHQAALFSAPVSSSKETK